MRINLWIAIGTGLTAVIFVVITIFLLPEKSDISSTDLPDKVGQIAANTGAKSTESKSQNRNQSGEPILSEAAVVSSKDNSSKSWMFFTLVIMAIAMLISISVSFYLYHWRKILLSEPHLIVPEQQGEWLRNLGKHIENLTHFVSSNIDLSKQRGKQTHQAVSNLSETFMTLQQALDEREKEIQRLKRGYDNEIFRKFVERFIRVDQAVEDFQRMGSADETGLDQIRRLLEDAFAECNVERFQPELGANYLEEFGVADNPKTVISDNPEDDFKIAEVLEVGYLIRSAENKEVVKPTKVRIYKKQGVE